MAEDRRKFNWLMLFITIFFGVVSWVCAALVREKLGPFVPRIILVGICFAVTALIVCSMICLVSKGAGTFEANIITGRRSAGMIAVYILIGTIIIFGAGVLMEYIYEVNFKKAGGEPTSYIFLIDDSGSMTQTDEEYSRYSAVNEMLKSKEPEFPYVVYSFSNDVTLMHSGKAADGGVEFSGELGDETRVRGALETAFDDYSKRKWDGGTNPKFVLLTDGVATDVKYYTQLDPILGKYAAKGITISCVGADKADEKLLNYVAEATGGVVVKADEGAKLNSAISTAALSAAARDLFSFRHGVRMGFVYAIIRVFTITLIGVLIGVLSALCYGDSDSANSVLVIAACKSLVAGLVLELGINKLGFDEAWCWLISWLLMCMLFVQHSVRAASPSVDYSAPTSIFEN